MNVQERLVCFLFTETLGHWRDVPVHPQRTAVGRVQEMADILENRYAEAEKVIVICDNLNTHTTASFYKVFPATQASRPAERIEIHYTPKHGSLLNIAECELSVLSRHCLRKPTPNLQSLTQKVSLRTRERNSRQCGVDWQFTTPDARTKLKSLYPHIQLS